LAFLDIAIRLLLSLFLGVTKNSFPGSRERPLFIFSSRLFMEKEILELRMEFPAGIEKELKESFLEILRSFELALAFSVAQKLVETKGMEKEKGEILAKEIKEEIARRLGL